MEKPKFIEAMYDRGGDDFDYGPEFIPLCRISNADSLAKQLTTEGFLPGDILAIVRLDDLQRLLKVAEDRELDALAELARNQRKTA